MGGAYPWLPLRSLSCHLDNRSRDCLGSSSLPLTLVLLGLVQLHLFLMIQLSVVILETHTVWIRLISTKDGKMETSRIRQETKTVQILLWPGRRPSFHFDHFETNSSWHFLDLLLLLLTPRDAMYSETHEPSAINIVKHTLSSPRVSHRSSLISWLWLCWLLLQGTQDPDYQEPSGQSSWHSGNPGTWQSGTQRASPWSFSLTWFILRHGLLLLLKCLS